MKIEGGNHSFAASQLNESVASPNTSARPSGVLDPALLNVEGSKAKELGTPRQLTVAFGLLNRATEHPLAQLSNELGEQDRVIKDQIDQYIDLDEMPRGNEQHELFKTINEGAAGSESREGRLKAVIEAGVELLESAKESGRNALHVVGRTGLVIALAAVARQYVGYLVEQALREGDTPDAGRVWLAASAAMTGPVLVVAGALLRHFDGESSLVSKLGAAFLTIGAAGLAIGACVTGAASSLFPKVAGGLVYNLVRALADLFVPLKDNAGPANAAATGVTAMVYGAFQFAQSEVARLMPSDGLARAAQGLGYCFRDELFPIVSTTVAQLIDAGVLIATKNSNWLSPRRGADSALFDEESLRHRTLKTETVLQWPTQTQTVHTTLNVAGARISFGVALAASSALLADYLSKSEFGDDTQGHILQGCLAVLAVFLYVALINSIAKRTDNTFDLETLNSA